MRRALLIIFLVAVAGMVVWFTSTPITPQRKTVGVVMYTATNMPTFRGFKQGMEDQGYPEIKSIEYIFHGPVQQKDQLDEAVRKLMAEKPDLIFACTTPASIAAKKVTAGTGVPVIFAPVNDPVASGVVENPLKPEANITGVRLERSDGKRLQILKEAFPAIRRVFVPYNPKDKSAQASLAQLEEARSKVGVELVTKEFSREITAEQMDSYVPENVDAIFLPREGLVMSRVLDFSVVAIKRRVPLSGPRYRMVEQGAVMGFGFMGREIGIQAARMAHLVLQGVPVEKVPVETAHDYLFFNLDTANRIGVKLPEGLLRRAHTLVR